MADASRMPATITGAAVQRAIIAPSAINGLAANLDTSDRAASLRQIGVLWTSGKIGSLLQLRNDLASAVPEAHPRNNEVLRAHIQTLLGQQAGDDPEAGNTGGFARWIFEFGHAPRDETGVTQQPGHAPVPPQVPTPLQTAALGVRGWQIGDIVDSVSWSTLGRHMQGRMSADDYVELGDGILQARDLKNVTDFHAHADDAQKSLVANQALARVQGEVRGGLNGLPAEPGVSYRAATARPGVYGSSINVGDCVKDMSFWSTAALKMPHTGADFGSEGTLLTPKVYYIITGSTGVYLPRYTNREVGVHEVLYRDQTIFRVNQITNYGGRTFFVHVTEVDPANLPAAQVTKNPWSGAVNP